MTFVEIEGPAEKLRKLYAMKGLDLSRGFRNLGGGTFRANGSVDTPETLAALKATGLTVRVTVDEQEVERRAKADHEMMKRGRVEFAAAKAARAKEAQAKSDAAKKPDGGGGEGKP